MKSTENHQSTYLSFRFELSGCVFMSCLVYFQEQFFILFYKVFAIQSPSPFL